MSRDLRILYVEDNHSNLRLIERLAGRLGFEFHGAGTGQEGIEKAKALKPDIILLDLILPDMDGLDVARRLRADEETERTPIIAITAVATDDGMRRALEAGCSDYLTKPAEIDDLISKLEKHLGVTLPRPSPGAFLDLSRDYRRVLVVDDTPENVTLLTKFLEAKGHEVLQAYNGAEALDLLLREPVDLIVSDVMMPEMDGFELCYTLRKHERLNDIPLIFYTVHFTSNADREFADRIGATAYFQGPLRLNDLYARLANALREKPRSAAGLTDEEFRSEHLNRLRTKLLLMSPRPEGFKDEAKTQPIDPGASYLIEEETPRKVYEVFKENVSAGAAGLCITRTNPQRLKRRLGMKETQFIWLSDTEIPGHVSTKSLTSLSVITWNFLQKAEWGVILLDGFEYLCTQNSFEASLGFIQLLKERVSTKKASLLLSVNPEALDHRELENLRKELEKIEP